MEFEFFKMHGAGNDFLVVPDPDAVFPVGDDAGANPGSPARDELVRRLCAPHSGLVCEGLILMRRRGAPAGSAFQMLFFNPDGSRASMCGNGARCAALCALREGWTGMSGSFASDAGPVPFEIVSGDRSSRTATVRIGMKDVSGVESCGPLSPEDSRSPCPPDFEPDGTWLVDTGVPHAVRFVDDLRSVDVAACGAFVRFHSRFPEGANADFVQIIGPGEIALRTYERGVEAETPACGTGVTAAAVVAAALGKCRPSVAVHVAFGDVLTVDCASCGMDGAHGIFLAGPASFVCRGTLETDWFAA